MKTNTRRTLGIVSGLLVLLTASIVITSCGRTYRSSEYTNPIQSLSTPTSVRHSPNWSGRNGATDIVILVTPEQAHTLIKLFDDSQMDPRAYKWQSAGDLILTDGHGNEHRIHLYDTHGHGPDAFKMDGIYYRNSGLLTNLTAWIANHSNPTGTTHAPETTH